MQVDEERHRFELPVDGMVVFADFRRQDGVLAITHVEAPVPLRGTGAADRLMRAIAAWATAQGVTILPLCGYAAAWFRRHPEHGSVLAGGTVR